MHNNQCIISNREMQEKVLYRPHGKRDYREVHAYKHTVRTHTIINPNYLYNLYSLLYSSDWLYLLRFLSVLCKKTLKKPICICNVWSAEKILILTEIDYL